MVAVRRLHVITTKSLTLGLLYLIGWAAGCAVCVCAAESKNTGCTAPLWTAVVIGDLGKARNLTSPDLIDSSRAGVTFLDNGRLVVREVVLDTANLSSRQNPASSPFRLRASVFDIGLGKSTASADWGTRPHESSIWPTTGGLLIRSGEVLRLYSSDFTQLKELTLPLSHDIYTVTVSPGGKTILINRHDQHLSSFEVLDGATLEARQQWSEPPPLRRLYSSSDTSIAAADFNQEHILFSRFASRTWRNINGKPTLTCVGLPTLVTDASLVNACKQFSYMSTDGALVFEDTFSKGEALARHVAVARDGSTVAVTLDRTKGSDFWDTGHGIKLVATYILVYDLSVRKRALTVEVDPLPSNNYDFALSPDGSRLAILNDQRVTVCSVPKEK